MTEKYDAFDEEAYKDDIDQEDAFEEEAPAEKEEGKLLQMYLDDISSVEPISDEELRNISPKIAAGDRAAANRAVEGNLRYVISLLWDYTQKGLSIHEMISEANLALADTVYTYEQGDLRDMITRAVKAAVEGMIAEDVDVRTQQDAITERMNTLSDLSVEMAGELGRQPTEQELAARLQIPADEVAMLLRMSINALTGNA